MRAWQRASAPSDGRGPDDDRAPAPCVSDATANETDPQPGGGFDLVGELLAAALADADHATLARRTVVGVRTLVGADICEIVRCIGGELELVSGIGLGGLVLEHRISMIADEPLVEAVVTSGRSVVQHRADDARVTLTGWAPATGPAPDYRERAALAVPVGDHPDEGVLLARCIGANRLTEHALETLETVASVLTLAQRRRGAEQDASRRARRDALTGLPNREVFRQRLASAIAADHEHGDTEVGVAIVDLDNFALINDGLGHDTGDQILRAVGERLQNALRPGDLLARFGGDEFAVAARGLRSLDDASLTGERLLGALHGPFVIGGRELTVRASVGVSIAGPDTSDGSDASQAADRLIRESDAALGLAKDRGRERVECFNSTIAAEVSNRLRTEREVRAALAGDELEIWYQPIVDVGTGRTAAVEALVRWEHPTRGLLTPAEFIPVSETTGLIEEIGRWVIEGVADQLCAWAAEDAVIPVAINLSPRQLLDEALVPTLSATLVRLAEAGVEAHVLTMEISERSLSPARADNRLAAAATIEAIAAMGITVTVDDFGAGTALLSQLRELPIDAVKIDRTLVAPMATSGADYAIVAALVSIARTLGTQVIAAGVETDEQFGLLADLGCDLAQGHLFSPAVPELRRGTSVIDHSA